jgi:hypothetical protein
VNNIKFLCKRRRLQRNLMLFTRKYLLAFHLSLALRELVLKLAEGHVSMLMHEQTPVPYGTRETN